MMKLYVFDAYGTLFDVHSAVRENSAALGDKAQAISDMWRIKQLEYTWVRSLAKADYQDFESLTRQALDFALVKFEIKDEALKEKLMAAYFTLKPYQEVKEVLTALKAKGKKTAILSNGSKKMLKAAVDAADLGELLDAVISVDKVEVFKPRKKVYNLIKKKFDICVNDITFCSSNRWDIAGASRQGINSLWINRTNQPDEYRDYPPSAVYKDLNSIIS